MSATPDLAPMELYMIVKDPELIRRCMQAKQPPLTARAVSKRLGWKSHSYMNRILSGETRSVSTDTAMKIAVLLGVPVDLIFAARVSGDSPQPVRVAS